MLFPPRSAHPASDRRRIDGQPSGTTVIKEGPRMSAKDRTMECMTTNPSCLVVDDNEAIREICMTVAASVGFECLEAESAEQALAMIEKTEPSLLLTDLILPGMTGLDLIREAQTLLPDLKTAIMTAHASVDSAIEAVRLRAD